MPSTEEMNMLREAAKAMAQNPEGNSMQDALKALEAIKGVPGGQAPTSATANDSINQAMDALKAFQGGGQVPTTVMPSSSDSKDQQIQKATEALKILQQQNAAAQQTQNSSVDTGIGADIVMEFKKFHTMLNDQGLQMQALAGFDYTGALANDGKLSEAESAVMFIQFAGKVEEEGHLGNRVSRRSVPEDTKQQAITAIENYLGDKADALDVVEKKDLDATIKLMSIPETSRKRIMDKAMQDADMREVRELPKSDKVSAVFHVPASGDQEAMTIELGKSPHADTSLKNEILVDANIYTPPVDDGPSFG